MFKTHHVGLVTRDWSINTSFHGSPYFFRAAITSATNSSLEPSARQRRVSVLDSDMCVPRSPSSGACGGAQGCPRVYWA